MTEISSLSDYLDAIRTFRNKNTSRNHLYRGHSKSSYKLEPSIFRTQELKDKEDSLIRAFIAENPAEFQTDTTAFDKLVRAQHYELPTRLLDVTTNPLVALWFACRSHGSADGEVILISEDKERQKFFDSDVISLLSNLAFLKRSEKEKLLRFAQNQASGPSMTDEQSVAEFQKCTATDRLIQTIKAEKPYFRNEIHPYDLGFARSVIPKRSNARIQAQDGQFIVFGIVEKNSGPLLEHFDLEKITVPSSAKKLLLEDLAMVNISEKTLFPGIEKAAKTILERY